MKTTWISWLGVACWVGVIIARIVVGHGLPAEVSIPICLLGGFLFSRGIKYV